MSKSMGWITASVSLAEWEGGQQNEIFDGQLVFAVPVDKGALSRHHGVRMHMPLLNIRHVNDFLRVGYAEAARLFDSSRGPSIISGEFTSDQLQLLADTPVRSWHHLEFFKKDYRASTEDSIIKQTVYLSEHLINERFNVYGWVHGQVPVDYRLKQVAVRRFGNIDDVENIWGNDVRPGHDLYLILRRLYDAGKGEWTHFSYVPWHGYGVPSLEDRAYMDFTGNLEHGCAIHIGCLDRVTHDYFVRGDELPQLLGIRPCTLQRVRIGPEPGCLRITAVGSKNRLPWLY
jgi:hypothetical protein